jgi:cytochrome c
MSKFLQRLGFFVATVLVGSTASAQTTAKAPEPPAEIQTLLQKNICLTCHKTNDRLVGPAYVEVANKKNYTPEQIVALIYKPKPENWPGYPPMAALPNVPKDEALKIAQWIVSLRQEKAPAKKTAPTKAKAPVSKKS